MPAVLRFSLRISCAAGLAAAFATLIALASHAGPTSTPGAGTPTPSSPPTATPTAKVTPTASPTPSPICDAFCELDKKCSVRGSEPQDACVAVAGDEVTYHYFVELVGGPVEVWDDKLGLIGETNGETLTKSTTLRQTTTNNAWLVELTNCKCVFGNPTDSVRVDVVIPRPSPTPTPGPTCEWPEVKVVTLAKGQSPSNNAKLTHSITGHIIDPDSLSDSAHRIEVCAGTEVTSVVTDTTGPYPTNTSLGNLQCSATGCSGVVNVTEKYQSTYTDGRDKDRITFIPK